MERFFRGLKNEWGPVTGYVSFSDAAHEITAYIVRYLLQRDQAARI